MERFALRDATRESEFLAADAQLQEWIYVHRAGLVRRTLARDGDANWMVLTIAASAWPPSDAEPRARWRALVDDERYRFEAYETLD